MAEKKRVHGVVDRVEGDVAVVVIRDPNDSESVREIYVDKKKLKRVDLKEGDDVTVEYSESVMEADADIVSLAFTGLKSGEMAKRFFSYLVDGGLEDLLIQRLSGKGVTLEISGSNKKNLTVGFQCSKDQPPKKAVRAPVKKPVKKVPAKKARKA